MVTERIQILGVSVAAGLKAASLIGKETLMLFVQPQRHQGTKIKVKFIGSIPIKDLIVKNTYHHFVS